MELKIIKHFGFRNQLKKLNEECYELIEAVNDYENQKAVCLEFCSELHCNKQREQIIEEMGDVLFLINQFKSLYEITDDDLVPVMEFKRNRTLERIETKYYK